MVRSDKDHRIVTAPIGGLIGALGAAVALAVADYPLRSLIACGVILCVVLILLRPRLVFSMLAFLYFGNFPSFKLAGYIPSNALLLGLGITVLLASPTFREGLDARYRALAGEKFFGWYTAFTGVVLISLTWTGGDSAVMQQVINTWVLAVVLYGAIDSLRAAREVLIGGILGSAVIGWAGIYKYAAMPVHLFPPKGINWFYGTEITLSYSCMVAFYVGRSLLVGNTRRGRKWIQALLVSPVVVLGGITSRGASMAWLGAYAVRRALLRPSVGIVVLVGCVVLVGVGLTLLPGGGWPAGTTSAFGQGKDAARLTSGRIYLYGAAWRMFRESPAVGIGWEQFRHRWVQYVEMPIAGCGEVPEFDVHCSYLQILTELGVLGFLMYWAWVWAIVRRLVRFWKRSGGSEMGRMVGWLVTGLAGVFLHGVVDNVALGYNRIHVILMVVALGLVRVAEETGAR